MALLMPAGEFDLHDAVIALSSLGLSAVAFISASRAATTAKRSEEVRSREAAHKVDAEAYQRAQAIYTEALAQLRRQNENQEKLLTQLSTRVAQLEDALHAAGLPLPRGPDGADPPGSKPLHA